MKDEAAYASTSPEASSNSLTLGDPPPKKKQKRNKPTLSCEECVERKTKVRGRPCIENCGRPCIENCGRPCIENCGRWDTCVMTPEERKLTLRAV
jgi:hypothetical protein